MKNFLRYIFYTAAGFEAEQQIFLYGQLGKNFTSLRNITDAAFGPCIAGKSGEFHFFLLYRTSRCVYKPHDTFHQRCLPGPVASNQTGDTAFVCLKTYIS